MSSAEVKKHLSYDDRIHIVHELSVRENSMFQANYWNPETLTWKDVIDDDKVLIDEMLMGKHTYLGNIPTGLKYDEEIVLEHRWIREGTGKHAIPSLLRIVEYNFDDSKDDPSNLLLMNDSLNACASIRLVLSDFRINNIIDTIAVGFSNVLVQGSVLIKNQAYKKYVHRKKWYLLQGTERFFKMITLDSFLRKHTMNVLKM